MDPFSQFEAEIQVEESTDSLYFMTENNIWILGMKPKDNSNANNYISSITVKGTDYIKQINIDQTNGNKTVIWFEK
mgnify:CR=1 FL=1